MPLPSPLIKLFNRDNGLEVRLWTAIYRLFFGRVGRGTVLSRADIVTGPHRIFIGEGVGIAHSARLDAIQTFGGRAYAGEIHIGDYTSIQAYFHLAAATPLHIGRYVLMGSRVFITDHDHEFADLSRPVAYQPLEVAPVRIDDYAWLGENVMVLKGVTIGHHAIIGANSVVTQPIPPFAIAAGAPARVLRMRQ